MSHITHTKQEWTVSGGAVGMTLKLLAASKKSVTHLQTKDPDCMTYITVIYYCLREGAKLSHLA